jgi:hypothetical protein
MRLSKYKQRKIERQVLTTKCHGREAELWRQLGLAGWLGHKMTILRGTARTNRSGTRCTPNEASQDRELGRYKIAGWCAL